MTGQPRPPIAVDRLAGYGLAVGVPVELELLTPGNGGVGRLVEGTVIDALPEVLVLETTAGGTISRVPYGAIGVARTRRTEHPAAS